MEIRNCKGCKKIFQYLNGPQLCPSCKEKEEDEFQKVKAYLKENPRASMTEVSEALEISVEKITRFLREGRLEISPDSILKLDCEGCGRPINTGRYCINCSGRLEGNLKAIAGDISRRAGQNQNTYMKYHKKD